MSQTDVYEDFDLLKQFVSQFLESALESEECSISSKLRRHIRQFKTLFPSLIYVALGTGTVYKLLLCKNTLELHWSVLTTKTKKMFIDYSALKIKPNDSEEKILKTEGVDKWLQLMYTSILSRGCEKDFINAHFDIKDQIKDHILKNFKRTGETIKLDSVITQPAKVHPIWNGEDEVYKNKKYNSGIYSHQNDKRHFLSIDLKEANYQILRLNDIVQQKTWDEFLSLFTDDEYFHRLKRLRLSALSFNEIHPNVQRKSWEQLILTLLTSLTNSRVFKTEEFAAWNSDEIIFHINDYDDRKSECENHIKATFQDWMHFIRIETFQLRAASPDFHYFAKVSKDKKIVWKCTNAGNMNEAASLLKLE